MKQNSAHGVAACPKCGDSGWKPNVDANGECVWTPLMNDSLPCECGALARKKGPDAFPRTGPADRPANPVDEPYWLTGPDGVYRNPKHPSSPSQATSRVGVRYPAGDRPSTEPGGCQCVKCGCIFIGSESHTECAECAAGVDAAQPQQGEERQP